MKNFIVYFEYFTDGESGSEKHRFSEEQAALDKMAEFISVIETNFSDCRHTEILHEPDFFGIRDHATGDFAKVIFQSY